MRTTLNIPDDLYLAVKVEAARRGATVTSLVEEAMRRVLAERETGPEALLPVSERSGGLKAGVDLNDPDQLFELLYESQAGV